MRRSIRKRSKGFRRRKFYLKRERYNAIFEKRRKRVEDIGFSQSPGNQLLVAQKQRPVYSVAFAGRIYRFFIRRMRKRYRGKDFIRIR